MSRDFLSFRLLTAALLFSASVVACAPPSTSQGTIKQGELAVCLYPNFQPFVGKDAQGVWSGWDVDYLKKFAEQQKLKLVIVESPEFDGIWNLPGEGKCDIAGSGISDLPERRQATGKLGVWSASYYAVLRAFAVRTDAKVEGLADLAGQPVIVTKGSTADLDLTNRIACSQPPPAIDVRRTNDEGAGAKEVTDGTAFAYGGGLGSIQDLVAVPASNLKVAWPHCFMTKDCKETNEPFSFIVRAESKGLAEALDAYIGAGQGGAWDYQGNVEKRQHGGDPVDCQP